MKNDVNMVEYYVTKCKLILKLILEVNVESCIGELFHVLVYITYSKIIREVNI